MKHFDEAPPEAHLSLDERLVLGHVAVLLLFLPWAFGGQIGWARELATGWALGGGAALALRLIWRRGGRRASTLREHAAKLWPLFGLTALGAIAATLPVFTAGKTEAGAVLVELPRAPWWPVAAAPGETWRETALFAGLVLTAANLALGLHHRRALRVLVVIVAVNAVILSGLGALQKLLGLSLYFGAVISPNPACFATFVYHNHWAAYALLGLTAGAALLFQRPPEEPARLHRTAALPLAAALLCVAGTLPLATSRSGTALAVGFGGVMLVTAAARLARRDPRHRRRWIGLAALAAVAATAVAAWLAQPFFERRIDQTAQQLAQLRNGEFAAVDDRVPVYRATLDMIAARPWFGWGSGGYGTVFPLYRRPGTAGLHFAHAHSDWLEGVAERGIVGIGLWLALPLVLFRAARGAPWPAFSRWLVGGAGLLALYAAVEFPFANPAVAVTWWVLLAAAARYRQLEHHALRAAAP